MIFIPGNVPSLKNSKNIISFGPRCPKCGKGKITSLIPSKTVEQWRKQTKKYWVENRAEFLRMAQGLEFPLRVRFTFVRKSKHRFDYTNALDTIQDEMVKHKWLSDDNSDILIPVIKPYVWNKEEPGVFIKVIKPRE